ncbi:hypothetical protein SAMN05444274_102236 [Mariniphaga anaerophila]|uniref:Uncharacterized protein n=1 Tax=Mariniphaga anaerophila TaxID=1484053 RepID=A0A1M4VWS6_9BACT|nr:hypothetical protein [Mariniphaga anaerophila]SHE73360.1 hypothetical protein SAMN05444274_102236 [Mariniphaga anaerophila]
MNSNLKRDQIPPVQAENWVLNMGEEEKLTFNLMVPPIVLQKETYKILTGENENRIRVYLGLEPEKEGSKFVLCAYAVSAFLMGSGEVFRDYENPVFKLQKENQNKSVETKTVIDNIKRYQKWRSGELDEQNEWARFRKFIYPKAYLLSKYELHEIFTMQNKEEAQISFGISKTMNAMVYPTVEEERAANQQTMVFDFSAPCPPICDESSIYSSEKNVSD